jgi:hypothetical protein
MLTRHGLLLPLVLLLAVASSAPAVAASKRGDAFSADQRKLAKLMPRVFALQDQLKKSTTPAKKAQLRKQLLALQKPLMALVQRLLKATQKQTGRRVAPPAVIGAALKRYAPAAYKVMQRRLAKARTSNTKMMMRNVKNALEMFHLDNKRLPTAKEGLAVLVSRRILQRPPKDGWGRPLAYELVKGKARYVLRSLGPDGKAKTADDLVFDGSGKWRK